jgi:hypothetical protein
MVGAWCDAVDAGNRRYRHGLLSKCLAFPSRIEKLKFLDICTVRDMAFFFVGSR